MSTHLRLNASLGLHPKPVVWRDPDHLLIHRRLSDAIDRNFGNQPFAQTGDTYRFSSCLWVHQASRQRNGTCPRFSQ